MQGKENNSAEVKKKRIVPARRGGQRQGREIGRCKKREGRKKIMAGEGRDQRPTLVTKFSHGTGGESRTDRSIAPRPLKREVNRPEKNEVIRAKATGDEMGPASNQ